MSKKKKTAEPKVGAIASAPITDWKTESAVRATCCWPCKREFGKTGKIPAVHPGCMEFLKREKATLDRKNNVALKRTGN